MHFTYDSDTKPDLHQGDLIKRTPEVDKILEDVHPHYFQSANYRFFLVLTQSCDLARRAGLLCKARYITIAAVRPIKKAIEREVEKLQYDQLEQKFGFCSENRKEKLRQFMERLLNNNEEEYFYLHREEPHLNEDHCAFLQLSIPLKAAKHYQTLYNARLLSLTQSFQHKLGYLVGSLYSRIGTDDWYGKGDVELSRFKEIAGRPLIDSELVVWLRKDLHLRVMKKLKAIENPTTDDFSRIVKEEIAVSENNKKEALDLIEAELIKLNIDSETAQRVKQRLNNNQAFFNRLK